MMMTAPVNIQLSDTGINKDAVNQKVFDLMKIHWSKILSAGNFLFKKFYHILCSQSQKEDSGPKKLVDKKWALKVKKAWRWLLKKKKKILGFWLTRSASILCKGRNGNGEAMRGGNVSIAVPWPRSHTQKLHLIIFMALELVSAKLINTGRLDAPPALSEKPGRCPGVKRTVENMKEECRSNSYVFYYTKKFAITKLSPTI